MEQNTLESILLRYSGRGMELLAPSLPPDFCSRAARQLYALPRGRVLLTTGFYVAGTAETDGPLGTVCLARALQALGFACTLLTDAPYQSLFEALGLETIGLEPGEPVEPALLDRLQPVAFVSLERCGKNALGHYANMRGVSIDAHTAPIDTLFALAAERGCFTLGIGDGGNEIGMGVLAEQIRQRLTLEPCVAPARALVLATVSNWGGYGLAACLQALAGQPLMPGVDWLEDTLDLLRDWGCVDGVTHRVTRTVDGLPEGMEREIYTALQRWADEAKRLE